MSKRKFTIQGSEIKYDGGIYTSKSKSGATLSAAKKAASQLFKMVENKKDLKEWRQYEQFKKNKSIKFILRETTQDSNKKSYNYEATMIQLDEPIVIVKNNQEITITRKINVKSCHDLAHLVQEKSKSKSKSKSE